MFPKDEVETMRKLEIINLKMSSFSSKREMKKTGFRSGEFSFCAGTLKPAQQLHIHFIS